MHLLVAIEPLFPGQEYEIDNFIKEMCSKDYLTNETQKYHPEWRKIRPREVRVYDFCFPKEAEKMVLADLYAYETINAFRFLKVMDNFLVKEAMRKVIGIEAVDRSIQPVDNNKRVPVRVGVIGKVNDFHRFIGSVNQEML